MRQRREKKIEAKCTEREYEHILNMASENNMTISEFIRSRVLVDAIPTYNLFENRVMKILCNAAGLVQLKVNELSDEKFEEFESNVKKIKEKNDLDDVLPLEENNKTDNN